MNDDCLTNVNVHFDNEIDDVHVKMIKGEKGDKGDKGSNQVAIQATKPTDKDILIWVDTSQEAGVFNPANYYKKTETYSKNDFALLTVQITLAAASETGGKPQITNLEISYPEGFTRENSVVISGALSHAGTPLYYSFGYLAESQYFLSSTSGAMPRNVILNDKKIVLQCFNSIAQEVIYHYKIVLMKID